MVPSSSKTYAVIAGGGTGGHVNPALAIAEALVASGHSKESIRFVGSKRGLEATLVPAAGFDILLLPGRGIQRRINVRNVRSIAGLFMAFIVAFWFLTRRRPRVVVSVGGYAAFPAAFAAVLLRVPLVLAESNAVPGAVHRLVGRVAKASAVALPGTRLPRATVTGNPVRADIAHLDRSAQAVHEARRTLGLPDNVVVVAAFGGSLGATTINRSVMELAVKWQARHDVAIYHAIGKRDWSDESMVRPNLDAGDLVYKAVEYESRMALVYQAADIAIARSGATTVAELAAAGLPSVLVPYPGATADHQAANARTLEAAGAAIAVPDASCNGAKLESVLLPLLQDPSKLEAMSAAALSLAVPDAALRVAQLVERHAND